MKKYFVSMVPTLLKGLPGQLGNHRQLHSRNHREAVHNSPGMLRQKSTKTSSPIEESSKMKDVVAYTANNMKTNYLRGGAKSLGALPDDFKALLTLPLFSVLVVNAPKEKGVKSDLKLS